ncbi:MAG: ABC transporter permease [Spirochaetes bacterium]|nr:ABC transporter permease [Spirochaetota bacterium]
MNMIFTIALRNVLRQKRRVLITSITIAVGITAFIVVDGMFAGWDGDSLKNVVTLTDGALALSTRAYDDDRDSLPLSLDMKNADEITSFIMKDKHVAGVAPRTTFRGELTDGDKAIPVRGIVIDPARDTTVFSLTNFLTGVYLDNTSSRTILVGSALAHELNLKIGDSITLSALTKYESHNADDFTVTGIFETTNPALNDGTVIMSFATANDFLDLDGAVSELFVAIRQRMDRPFTDLYVPSRELKKQVNGAFANLAVYTAEERNAVFVNLMAMKKKNSGIIMFVILLIAAVGIVNTVLMSVYERIREVGVLRAHGFTPKQVVRMFMIEGTAIGVVGSLMGIVLGGLINFYLVYVGIDYTHLPGMEKLTSALPVWGAMHNVWNPAAFVQSACFGIAVALIASIIPARRAGRITVTSALRFQ